MSEKAPFDEAYGLGEKEMPHWPTGKITTSTGGEIYPLAPKVEQIRLLDIANGLANCCRWGKQCRFYSVAEHSALMADWLASMWPDEPELQFWALLHDASDYVLPDVPSPYKHALPGFAAIERRMQATIYQVFGMNIDDYPAKVKDADQRIRADEAVQAMGMRPQDVGVVFEPLGVTLQFWSPQEAARQWLLRINRFSRHFQTHREIKENKGPWFFTQGWPR